MTDGPDDIVFYLKPSFRQIAGGHWLVVHLALGPDIVWDVLPNLLTRRSAITPRSLHDLRTREPNLLVERNRVLLRDLRINFRPVPDLEVAVSQAAARLDVDGVLGLDFFERFASVNWKPATNMVVLSHHMRS